MTESEWLSSRKSCDMLGFIRDRATERQFRLFSVACCRRIWQHLGDERSRQAVDVAELDIDGKIGDSERISAAHAAAEALAQIFRSTDIRRDNGHLYHAAWAAALCSFTPQVPLSIPISRHEISGPFDRAILTAVHSAYANAIASVHHIKMKRDKHSKLEDATQTEFAEQCHLVRAIFGNPFSPVQSA